MGFCSASKLTFTPKWADMSEDQRLAEQAAAYEIVAKYGGEIKGMYILWSDSCMLSIIDYPDEVSSVKSVLAITAPRHVRLVEPAGVPARRVHDDPGGGHRDLTATPVTQAGDRRFLRFFVDTLSTKNRQNVGLTPGSRCYTTTVNLFDVVRPGGVARDDELRRTQGRAQHHDRHGERAGRAGRRLGEGRQLTGRIDELDGDGLAQRKARSRDLHCRAGARLVGTHLEHGRDGLPTRHRVARLPGVVGELGEATAVG